MDYNFFNPLAWTIASTVTALILHHYVWKNIQMYRSSVLISDLPTCKAMLSKSSLAQRAGPNQRLVIAFGINNAFTTTDREYHRFFRLKIEKCLSSENSQETRDELNRKCSEDIQGYLAEQAGYEGAYLVKLIQVLTLKLVLRMFYPRLAAPSTNDLEFMASKINKLWTLSKHTSKLILAKHFPYFGSIPREKRKLESKIKKIFATLTSVDITNPMDNPLAVILPAYMGMWKVVLRCFLEVRFRSSLHDRKLWTSLFSKFLRDNETWYTQEDEVSVQLIIAETLRLYPPTRRIYREQENGTSLAVDIEAMHRNGEVWGHEALTFLPNRWTIYSLDVRKTKEYMPFGHKEAASFSQCPSRVRGGPKLIATLVGALLEEVGDEWVLVADGVTKSVLHDTPLDTSTNAYQDLKMRRKSIEGLANIRSSKLTS